MKSHVRARQILSELFCSVKMTELRLWKQAMKYSFSNAFLLTKWTHLAGGGCGPGFGSVNCFTSALERFYGARAVTHS